jgi:hypothetical protein
MWRKILLASLLTLAIFTFVKNKINKQKVVKAPEDLIIVKLKEMEEKLEHMERGARHRFRLALGVSFMVLSLTVAFAANSVGAAFDLRWLIIILLFGGALLCYWSWLIYTKNCHTRLAKAGSILLVVGVSIFTALFPPSTTSRVSIIGGSIASLILLSAVILFSLTFTSQQKTRSH